MKKRIKLEKIKIWDLMRKISAFTEYLVGNLNI